jgi:DNA-binding transcriptional MerR regulator
MYTVTGLARRCGLGRTTILYYESRGLLKPASRSAGNYRQYGERELERLRQIRAYRHVGLSLADIRTIVGRPATDAAAVLQKRLARIDREIETLRGHQRVILRLLGNRTFRRAEMITKEKWVAIMKGCGFTPEQMDRWHAEFERSAPAEHQEFLEFLHIPADEIKRIRTESAKGAR